MCIDSVTPLSGPPGTIIEISGRNLQDPFPYRISHGIVAVERPKVVLDQNSSGVISASPLRAAVPLNVGSGHVRVSLYGSVARFPTPFVLTPGFAWFTRLGKVGDLVTIHGKGLMPNGETPIVTFTGGAQATPVVADDQIIAVRVPVGAQTGPIAVDSSSFHATSASLPTGQEKFYLCEPGVGCWTEQPSQAGCVLSGLAVFPYPGRFCIDQFEATTDCGTPCPAPALGQLSCYGADTNGLFATRGPYRAVNLPDGGTTYTQDVVNERECVPPDFFPVVHPPLP